MAWERKENQFFVESVGDEAGWCVNTEPERPPSTVAGSAYDI